MANAADFLSKGRVRLRSVTFDSFQKPIETVKQIIGVGREAGSKIGLRNIGFLILRLFIIVI